MQRRDQDWPRSQDDLPLSHSYEKSGQVLFHTEENHSLLPTFSHSLFHLRKSDDWSREYSIITDYRITLHLILLNISSNFFINRISFVYIFSSNRLLSRYIRVQGQNEVPLFTHYICVRLFQTDVIDFHSLIEIPFNRSQRKTRTEYFTGSQKVNKYDSSWSDLLCIFSLNVLLTVFRVNREAQAEMEKMVIFFKKINFDLLIDDVRNLCSFQSIGHASSYPAHFRMIDLVKI